MSEKARGAYKTRAGGREGEGELCNFTLISKIKSVLKDKNQICLPCWAWALVASGCCWASRGQV